MAERSSLVKPKADYGFSIRDNYDPIVLIWEDEVNDLAIAGEMPFVRKNYKEQEVEFAALWSQLDMLDMSERNMKWEKLSTST